MKWIDLKTKLAEIMAEPTTSPWEMKKFELALLLEIHGDLDQIALAQREQVKYVVEVFAPLWSLQEERGVRTEARAAAMHEKNLQLADLAIERELRQRAQDLAWQETYGLTEQTKNFIEKILGDKVLGKNVSSNGEQEQK